MHDDSILQQAREAVAATIGQPYNRRAVLRGDWDRGSLVQQEVARLRAATPVR